VIWSFLCRNLSIITSWRVASERFAPVYGHSTYWPTYANSLGFLGCVIDVVPRIMERFRSATTPQRRAAHEGVAEESMNEVQVLKYGDFGERGIARAPFRAARADWWCLVSRELAKKM
ncbi:7492_t:CDS:2, partial [Acaulospora colombiana]